MKWTSRADVYAATTLMLGLLATSLAEAQTETISDTKAYGLRASLQYDSNLYEIDSAKHESNMSLWLTPSFNPTQELRLSALGIFSKEFYGDERLMMATGQLAARHAGWKITPHLTFSPGAFVTLPVNEDLRDRASLIFGATASPRVYYNFSSAKSNLLNRFSGFVGLTATRNFHEFTVTTDGISNSEYTFSAWLWNDFEVLDQLVLTAYFIRTWGVTYGGNQKDKFSLGQILTYQVQKNFYVSLEHSNEGSLLKANGVDSNLGVFDENASTLTGAITFIY